MVQKSEVGSLSTIIYRVSYIPGISSIDSMEGVNRDEQIVHWISNKKNMFRSTSLRFERSLPMRMIYDRQTCLFLFPWH